MLAITTADDAALTKPGIDATVLPLVLKSGAVTSRGAPPPSRRSGTVHAALRVRRRACRDGARGGPSPGPLAQALKAAGCARLGLSIAARTRRVVPAARGRRCPRLPALTTTLGAVGRPNSRRPRFRGEAVVSGREVLAEAGDRAGVKLGDARLADAEILRDGAELNPVEVVRRDDVALARGETLDCLGDGLGIRVRADEGLGVGGRVVRDRGAAPLLGEGPRCRPRRCSSCGLPKRSGGVRGARASPEARSSSTMAPRDATRARTRRTRRRARSRSGGGGHRGEPEGPSGDEVVTKHVRRQAGEHRSDGLVNDRHVLGDLGGADFVLWCSHDDPAIRRGRANARMQSFQ